MSKLKITEGTTLICIEPKVQCSCLFYKETMRAIQEILDRKRQGIDCTEEESAEIKGWLKDSLIQIGGGDIQIIESIQELFPQEYGEYIDSQYDEYILPSIYASALVNGDRSGLTKEDEKELDEWLEKVNPGSCIMVDGIEWFNWGHDMNSAQGATVTKFYFDKR